MNANLPKPPNNCPPILYLIFNRPDLMEQSFAPIRVAKPSQLFIAADGPRRDREGEAERCAEARRIIDQVDWPCEVKTLFRENNLGCRKAVSEGITWFFEHVEEGIILEDDCVADHSFFRFCAELLDRYRDDDRIMAISGDNFQGPNFKLRESYYFSIYPHCWGWATWKRAWVLYEAKLRGWPLMRTEQVLKGILCFDEIANYWTAIFDNVYQEKLDSWAFPWTYSCWVNDGMSILPRHNLVKNIGFTPDGLHTTDSDSWLSQLTAKNIAFPLIHPQSFRVNKLADKRTGLSVFLQKKIWIDIGIESLLNIDYWLKRIWKIYDLSRCRKFFVAENKL